MDTCDAAAVIPVPSGGRFRQVIPEALSNHVEAACHGYGVREASACAADVSIARLRHLDERLAAHLDGIRVAGSEGLQACRRAFESEGASAVFTLAASCLESGDVQSLQHVFAVCEVSTPAGLGLLGHCRARSSAY